MTNNVIEVEVCEFCGEPIAGCERWSASDHLSDHITEEHQDQLPNTYMEGDTA